MAASEDPSGVTELAMAAVAPIEAEVRHRLLAEVGEQDLLAIETGLLKAFLNGMGAGIAEMSGTMIDESSGIDSVAGFAGQRLPASVPLDQRVLPRMDPWAERYRDRG